LSSQITYIIPAREGSKGIKHKNRYLFKHTADIIPKELNKQVYVTTDDIEIMKLSDQYNFNLHKRNAGLSGDRANIRDVLEDVIVCQKISGTVVLLYLTYPTRTWSDVQSAINFFNENNGFSLLCSEPIETHPYMCFSKLSKYKGKPIISHNLYRRQDYPECFRLSHYICIFRHFEIIHLGPNMYNGETLFFSLDKMIDVDTKSDLAEFETINE